MTKQEAIRFARFYLYNQHCFGLDGQALRSDLGGKHSDGKITDYQLHRHLQFHLQFHLCDAFDRLSRTFGETEIVNKDIALIVETWIMSSVNHWERIGHEKTGWRKVQPLIKQNETHPTATAISDITPDW